MWFEILLVFILLKKNKKKRPNISGIQVVYSKCSELSFDAILFLRKKTNIMFKKDILLMLQQSSVIPSVDI